MLFLPTFLLATAASALPTGTTKRDADAVLANLQTIDANTNTLTSVITAWDGSVLGALGIAADVTTLEDSINAATNEVASETTLTSAETTTLLTYVTDTLTPDLQAAVDALVAAEPAFDADGLDATVLGLVEDLRDATDALGAALVGIAADDQVDAAQDAVAVIDGIFAVAVAAYS